MNACHPSLRTLWLPLRRPGWAWSLTALSFLFFAASALRDQGFYDSPELTLAAQTWSLGHPPGQPLHTLLAGVLARFPLGPVPLRVSLLSCLAAALSVLCCVSLLDSCLERAERRPAPWSYALSLALLGVVAQHAALWEQSTRPEVYALAAAACLWALARLAHALPRVRPAQAFAAGFALGLAVSANPLMAAFVALALGPAWLSAWRRRELSWHVTGWAVAGGVAGLLPYLYVPVIGHVAEGFVWGRPDTPERLADFLTAAEYARNLQTPPQQWAAQGLDWMVHASLGGRLPLWLVGLAALAWRPAGGLGRWTPLWIWALATLHLTRNAVWHPDVPDYESYVSVAGWLCCTGWAVLAVELAELGMRAATAALAVAALALVLLAPPGLFARTRAVDRTASSLVESAFSRLPDDAILVVESDHWAAPLLYARYGLGHRPDVLLLIRGLSSSSWYWQELYRLHPRLRPFELRGPGGRAGRLRRFLTEQGARPVWFEHAALAQRLGYAACPDLLLVRSDGHCEPLPRVQRKAADLLRTWSERLGQGAPTSRQVLASISLRHGDALWRAGQPAHALSIYLAVHPELSPAATPAQLGDVPRLEGPVHRWRRSAAIGDPARTLFMAAQIALAANQSELAARWLLRAAADGLPEAQALVERAQRVPAPVP